MIKCIIRITTVKNEYVETMYGVMETMERINELQCCHNIIGIDMISGETGEILYQQLPNGEFYVDNNALIDLISEEYFQTMYNRG